MAARRVVGSLLVAATLTLAGCSPLGADGGTDVVLESPTFTTTADLAASQSPEEQSTDSPTATTSASISTTGTSGTNTATLVETRDAPERAILIDPAGQRRPIDPRLFGTNIPAWIGPDGLADPRFRERAVESGTTLIRLPGGSWSNAYDWRGCEERDEDHCYWLWAARPSDFVAFLHATGIPGSWTVNINETAEAAAAAVAFFNGDPDDERPIGTDRDGIDWGTVGRWARLRVENGNAEPAGIQVWEVGNEVYGGRPVVGGPECASFGWEDVWTCDGTEYVMGNDDYDGYLAISRAMRNVDPEIEVGAVGVAPPDAWGDFGREVIDAAAEELDFYVVHSYGFNRSPEGDEALRRPESLVPELIAAVRAESGSEIPIAITEYNLVAFAGADTGRTMIATQNALYIADVIGQMAIGGVSIANQWNFVSGVAQSGTNYGLVDGETLQPYPQWEALTTWSRAGRWLLTPSTGDDLHVYPTLHADDRITIIVVNLSGTPAGRAIGLADGATRDRAVVHTVRTTDLDATEMLADSPRRLMLDPRTEISFPGWSISRVEVPAPG